MYVSPCSSPDVHGDDGDRHLVTAENVADVINMTLTIPLEACRSDDPPTFRGWLDAWSARASMGSPRVAEALRSRVEPVSGDTERQLPAVDFWRTYVAPGVAQCPLVDAEDFSGHRFLHFQESHGSFITLEPGPKLAHKIVMLLPRTAQRLNEFLLPTDFMPHLLHRRFVLDPWRQLYVYELTMRYIGPTLYWALRTMRSRIKNRTQRSELVDGLFMSVWARTATHMHARQHVHGDLHTKNIVFDEHGEVWLIDMECTRQVPLSFHYDLEPVRGCLQVWSQKQQVGTITVSTEQQFMLHCLLPQMLAVASCGRYDGSKEARFRMYDAKQFLKKYYMDGAWC